MGKITIKKNENDIKSMLLLEGDEPHTIPHNWSWTRLSSSVDVIMGQSPKGEFTTNDSTYIPLIGGAADMGSKYPSVKRYTKKPTKLSQENDVILSVRATLGRPIYSDGEYCLGRGVAALRSKVVKSEYIKYYLETIESRLYELGSGTTFAQISKKIIGDLEFPLPPVPEQQRIVNRIESLFEKIDKAQELIGEAREGFEKRKEAILAKAFRGELTAKWREENIDIDSGENVVSKIKEDRESAYNTQCMEAKKQGIRKPKMPRFLKDITCKIKNETIPDNWTMSYIYEIGDVELGGTPSRDNSEYWEGKIPWLSSGEVANNILNNSKEKITNEGVKNSNAKLYPIGTVLIAMIGEGKTRGQTSLLEFESCTNQNVAGVICNQNYIVPKFIWYNFIFNYEKNRSVGRGGNQPALNGQKVGEIVVPIPPFEEQIQIIRSLDTLIEKELKAYEIVSLEQNINEIKKSILAKAFRGELGTNDPSEESSILLLNDILKK